MVEAESNVCSVSESDKEARLDSYAQLQTLMQHAMVMDLLALKPEATDWSRLASH